MLLSTSQNRQKPILAIDIYIYKMYITHGHLMANLMM